MGGDENEVLQLVLPKELVDAIRFKAFKDFSGKKGALSKVGEAAFRMYLAQGGLADDMATVIRDPIRPRSEKSLAIKNLRHTDEGGTQILSRLSADPNVEADVRGEVLEALTEKYANETIDRTLSRIDKSLKRRRPRKT
jgi:hypothetical protein